MKRIHLIAYVLVLGLGMAGCSLSYNSSKTSAQNTPSGAEIITPTTIEVNLTTTFRIEASPTVGATQTSTQVPPIVFAVIGDYGSGDDHARDVALLVTSWNPNLIITTGDNNYPLGDYGMIDEAIGKYYQSYIKPYMGSYGDGSEINRFFPSLGNHDWMTDDAKPYMDYFELPGNERYYFFNWEFIDFFVLDSNGQEPDGVTSDSIQGNWLKEQLNQSTAAWKIVYFHQPPYSSGFQSSVLWMRWPFQEWGADLIISGHDHDYERLEINGLTYLVNGLGGGTIYDFLDPLPESLVRYNQDHGAMRVEVSQTELFAQFMNTQGEIIDEITITHAP